MAKKEMTSAEHTKKVYEESPYKDKARDSDMRNKLNAMTNTAGAGRGDQGGPTAKQADQNKAMMSPTERAVREEQDFKKWSEPNENQKYAKGGTASKRADGIATKGKTRGTMIMCGGGMAWGKK
jgi:hypothetical protein